MTFIHKNKCPVNKVKYWLEIGQKLLQTVKQLHCEGVCYVNLIQLFFGFCIKVRSVTQSCRPSQLM